MTNLRSGLTEQLARKVDAHGLVIWNDDAQEYSDVAETMCPAETRFEKFAGSWYELRRRIDDAIGGDQPPRLVVYVAAKAPSEDPLAEVRSMGSRFTLRLATLISQSLTGELTQTRIDDLARTTFTLTGAEQALSADESADARLISALGTTDSTTMLVSLLLGNRDDEITRAAADGIAQDFIEQMVGVQIPAASKRHEALFAGLLLNDFAIALGGPPHGDLATATPQASAKQRDRSRLVLRQVLSATGGRESYRSLATKTDLTLNIAQTLDWDDRLAAVPGTESVEQLALDRAIEQFRAGNRAPARTIAETRLNTSPFVDEAREWAPRWRVFEAMATLEESIDTNPVTLGSVSSQLAWYADRGYTVDRAHRTLELVRTTVGALGDLDGLLNHARDQYDGWLNELLNIFVDAALSDGVDPGDMMRQGEIHDRLVNGHDRVAYIWVDALRYELAHDLVGALKNLPGKIQLLPAVAAVPTITPVGMASLLPGAAETLQVKVDNDSIVVSVGGQVVKTVADRISHLRLRHGAVVDLDLNDATNKSEQSLHRSIQDASLVVVRSQEVDAAGESGMLAAAWTTFSAVNQLLATVITRLASAGIRRFVLSADHGFIALSQGIGAHRIVDPPTGAAGVLKRRCFVGHGGVPQTATAKLPLSACGVTSDSEITVPRGLAVFRAGGATQFFHGGLSPQELIVPVIIIDLDEPPRPNGETVRLGLAGERIVTGVFAITLEFDPSLFADDLTVRPVASRHGQPVARPVSGDGVDAQSGTVTLSGARTSVVTFQVTVNLAKGDTIDLQALDAATGRTVAKQTASVAAPVIVEDDLD
jgi:hypothetical protein